MNIFFFTLDILPDFEIFCINLFFTISENSSGFLGSSKFSNFTRRDDEQTEKIFYIGERRQRAEKARELIFFWVAKTETNSNLLNELRELGWTHLSNNSIHGEHLSF